jgi:hypothetical protein
MGEVIYLSEDQRYRPHAVLSRPDYKMARKALIDDPNLTATELAKAIGIKSVFVAERLIVQLRIRGFA